jgi:hypothetical protein
MGEQHLDPFAIPAGLLECGRVIEGSGHIARLFMSRGILRWGVFGQHFSLSGHRSHSASRSEIMPSIDLPSWFTTMAPICSVQAS